MAVYLDHAATTPMRPRAYERYIQDLGVLGNPASIHQHGQRARTMLESSRDRIAARFGVTPTEVVFTSGGTESVNLGIKGLWFARNEGAAAGAPERPRIVAAVGEHHATVDSVAWLQRHAGAELVPLPIDREARIDPAMLRSLLRAHADRTALVTFSAANNEVGTLQRTADLVAIAREFGVPVHVDAIAALGHAEVDPAAWGASAVSLSAHKIGGPIGIGALIVARDARLAEQVSGGGQQRRLRSGTQDAPAASAFASALDEALDDLEPEARRLARLRDRLVDEVQRLIPGAHLRGPRPGPDRLPMNAHFTFDGTQGDSLLFALDMQGVSVSTGSACQAGVPEVSHVLLAMGLDEAEAAGALRITLGHTTFDDDIDALLEVLPGAVASARRAGRSDRAVRLGGSAGRDIAPTDGARP